MIVTLKKFLLIFLSLLLSFQLAFSLENATSLLKEKNKLLVLKKELEKDSKKLNESSRTLKSVALWSTLMGVGIILAGPIIDRAISGADGVSLDISSGNNIYYYAGFGAGLAVGGTTFLIGLEQSKKRQNKDKEIQKIENRIFKIEQHRLKNEQKKLINKYKFRIKEHYHSNCYIALSNISKRGIKQVDKEAKKLISLYGNLYNLDNGLNIKLGKLFLLEELLGFYNNYKQSNYYVFEDNFTEAQKKQKIEVINKNEKRGKYKDLSILANATKKIESYLENNKIVLNGVIIDIGKEVLVNEKEIMKKLLLPFTKKENKLKLQSTAVIASLAGDNFYNFIMNKVRYKDYDGLMAFYEILNIRHGVERADFNYQPSITIRIQNVKIDWEGSGKYIFSRIVNKNEFRKLFKKLNNFEDLSSRYCFNINNSDPVELAIVLKNKNSMLKYKKRQKIKARFNFYENYTLERDIIKKY